MIYIKDGIVEKVISLHSYEIMECCKQNDTKCITALREYLKGYLDIDYDLPFVHLYYHLIRAVLEICNEREINEILLHDIGNYYDKMLGISLGKKTTLNYEDLCNILITKLMFTQVRDKGVDLFLIDIAGKLVPMSEYEKESELTL